MSLHHDSVRFALRQTFFGMVLMVQRTERTPGFNWRWGSWRRAQYTDIDDLYRWLPGHFQGAKSSRGTTP